MKRYILLIAQHIRQPLLTGAVLLCLGTPVAAADIVSIDLQSGPRGLVMAVNTNKPLEATPVITKKSTSGTTRTVTLRLPGTGYTASERHFTGLPDPAIVSDITVATGRNGEYTDITIRTAKTSQTQPTVKTKDTRVLALICADALPSFSWNSTRHTQNAVAVPAPAAAKAPAIIARAVSIRERVNVRSSPATDSASEIIGHLRKGDTVSVTRRSGEWTCFEFNNRSGWSLTEFLSDPGASANTSAPKTAAPVQAASADPVLGAAAQAAAMIRSKNTAVAPAPAPQTNTSEAIPAQKPLSGKPDSVVYAVLGRDPFIPYSPEESQLPNTLNLELVGVIYSDKERIALMEDGASRRKPYAFHERDAVENGTVLRINPTSVVFLLTEMGISRTVTIEIKKDLNTKIN